MGSVLIRNLDEDIIARLKARAMARGTSLEQFLREGVTRLAAPSRDEMLDELRAIRARAKPSTSTAAEEIRAWRDGGDDRGWA